MKIQIDLPDTELWARFKSEVERQGKTLREVVPTVFEPALRWFLRETPKTESKAWYDKLADKLEPGQVDHNINGPTLEEVAKAIGENELSLDGQPPIIDRITPPKAPPTPPPTKRCDLCDMPTERTFNHNGKKVCYTCWRDGIINEAASKTSLPEAPASSA